MRPSDRKSATMADDISRLEKEIGDRIDAAVKADPRSREAIAAALGITAGALQKIQEGKSTTQYAKFAQMAQQTEVPHALPPMARERPPGIERRILCGRRNSPG